MTDDDGFIRAGEVIKALFDKIAVSEGSEYSRLKSGWEDIVGNEIAFHVVPQDLVNNQLIVEADHPGWSQKISLIQGHILTEIRRRYPELEIKKIKVRVSKLTGVSRTTPPEKNDQPEAKNDESSQAAPPTNDDRSFFELLEKMKSRGKS